MQVLRTTKAGDSSGRTSSGVWSSACTAQIMSRNVDLRPGSMASLESVTDRGGSCSEA